MSQNELSYVEGCIVDVRLFGSCDCVLFHVSLSLSLFLSTQQLTHNNNSYRYCTSSLSTCSEEICEFAERCVDRFKDIETESNTKTTTLTEEGKPWDVSLDIQDVERFEQLNVYWLDAMDQGQHASMEFVRQQLLLGSTWILRVHNRLDFAIEAIEKDITAKENQLKVVQKRKLEALSASIQNTEGRLDSISKKDLPRLLESVNQMVRTRISTKTLMQNSLAQSLRCNMQKEVFSFLETSNSRRGMCGLCSRWCEVSDDISIEDIRAQIRESTMVRRTQVPLETEYTYPKPQKQRVEFPAVPCSFDVKEPWTLSGLKTTTPSPRYCIPNADVLKSEYVYFCPPEHSRVVSVELTGYEIEGHMLSKHAVFNIEVNSEDGNSWRVEHRYSDFESLRQSICDKYGQRVCAQIVFPEKKYFGNLNTEFLRDRQQGLETWLNRIIGRNVYDDDIREFLNAGVGSGSTNGSCSCMTPFTVDVLNARRKESHCVPICGLRSEGFLFQHGSGKCLHK